VLVSRVEIANHSRIADLNLEIRGHAVIIGANDVGKTSILRLLDLLLGSTAGQLYQRVTLADLADPARELAVEAVLTAFTDEERRLFPREISVDPGDHSESLWVRLTAAADPDDAEAVLIRRWFPEADHDRPPSREQLTAFGWRFLPATRGTAAAALDGERSALHALLKAIDLGPETAGLGAMLESFNSKLSTSKPITDLRSKVASHLSKAMPRTITQDDISLRTASDPQEDVLGDVSMFFERDGRHVPVAEQSDGLRQLMSMTLFDLAEGAANVVAIDEPELHLHPASQRTVADLFRSAGNQKILVTHSPYIVQPFEPSQVIAVDPDGCCHQIPAGKLTAVEKERASWWSPRLLEVLAARYAIVVEGVSDRIVVEAAARLMNISMDRIGAVVFDIDGAQNFPHVYKLIGKNGFCVKIVGLVDEQEKLVWHGQIGGKPAAVFGTTLWASEPDLEAEYCRALTGPGTAKALTAAGFCREDGIVSSCGAPDIDQITDDAAAAFCRKDKIGAARAIATQLDLAAVTKITSVHGLLQKLRALGEAR
jgi:putative ATP-dependent endonuclease of the OLD family